MSSRWIVSVGLVSALMLAMYVLVDLEREIVHLAAAFPSPSSAATVVIITPTIANVTEEKIPLPQPILGRISTATHNNHSNLFWFSNICYHALDNTIELFTDHAGDLEPFLAKNKMARNLRMIFKFRQRNTSEFPQAVNHESSTGKLLLPNDQVLLFAHEQPAHCLHDLLFSLFLDSPQGVQGTYYLPKASGVHAHVCDLNRDWCCNTFARAGQLNPILAVTWEPNRPRVCLTKVLMPVFGRARYAPDWTMVSIKERNEVFDMTGFNLDHLQSLHTKVTMGADSQLLVNRAPGFALARSKRINVLVVDRTADRRRIWNNAKEFVSLLALQWGNISTEAMGSLHYLGKQFAELTPMQQAGYFHSADVIISPHGAQLANLIYAVPGRTVAVEVSCFMRQKQLNQSELDWFGTFSTRLGVRFLRYGTADTRTGECDHNVKRFDVDPKGLLQMLINEQVFTESYSLAWARHTLPPSHS
ncbi:hypothetical protein BASA81_004754 [Batrachochytrium salamandrivorans]|nr:hypothetical protein BASA81_004754 [Batrachochytrium salamandrivorans]